MKPTDKRIGLRRVQFSLGALLLSTLFVAMLCLYSVAKIYEAQNRSVVFVGVDAQIAEVLVEQGQFVTEGEILAKLSNPSLEHALATLDKAAPIGTTDEPRRNKLTTAGNELMVRATSSGKLVSSTDGLRDRMVMRGQRVFTIQRPFPMTGFWIVAAATCIGLLVLSVARQRQNKRLNRSAQSGVSCSQCQLFAPG